MTFLIQAFGTIFLLLATLALLVTYKCVIRHWNFFSKQKVKFIRGRPFIGCLHGSAIGDRIKELYDAYPMEPFIGIYLQAGQPCYLIRDAELVKQMTTTDFDNFRNHCGFMTDEMCPVQQNSVFYLDDNQWKSVRSNISTFFTLNKLRLFVPQVEEVSVIACTKIHNDINATGSESMNVEMSRTMRHIIIDVALSFILGLKINSVNGCDKEFFKVVQKFLQLNLNNFLMDLSPRLSKFFKIKVFDTHSSQHLQSVLLGEIKHRQNSNLKQSDLLSTLLEQRNSTNSQWTDIDLISQSITVLPAAVSTAWLTLNKLIDELSLNQDIQEHLYQELRSCSENLNGTTLDLDTIRELKYLDMVCLETLRRWGSVYLDRTVSKPYTLETSTGNKVQLNVGDIVYLASGGIQLDEKYFPDPYKFDPERFSDANKDNMASGSFVPFSMGPRMCIGSKFAMVLMKVIVYHLVREFRFDECDKLKSNSKLECLVKVSIRQK